MSLTVKQLRPGQVITLVSKGVIRYLNSNYVDETLIGNTIILEVTRVGRQYIYGRQIYFNNGRKESHTYETRIDPSEYIILDGIRDDIEQLYRQYRLKLQEYEQRRQEALRNFESEARNMILQKMAQWEKENPRPHPIDLDKLA